MEGAVETERRAKNKPRSASQPRSHRGEEALRAYVCVCVRMRFLHSNEPSGVDSGLV